MIFEALQFELFRFKIHSLGSKIQKFPEFNLVMIIHISSGFLNAIDVAEIVSDGLDVVH